MSGETANIAEVANKVSKNIFKEFKWEKIPYMDTNFPCHKQKQHKNPSGKSKATSGSKHTHPVDVVFKYFDPYLNKNILLNTDLKSYAKPSITKAAISGALKSLAFTIDCARSSKEWRNKYHLNDEPFEVRGMLFVYNHDGDFDSIFHSLLTRIDPKNLKIKENQLIHVIEPLKIRYLTTIINDLKRLKLEKKFPENEDDYNFFHPDLYLHKAQGDPKNHPATVEMICSPYMILQHGRYETYDPKTKQIVKRGKDGGYLIYYNQDGSTEYEFIYLFDTLSRFQMLMSRTRISIRVAHHTPCEEIKNNYERAIQKYVHSWGNDKFKERCLRKIDFEIIPEITTNYMPGHLAWRY
jgi:hypothetical protein